MRRLLAAELMKLTTTRLNWWLLLAALAITALYASLSIAFADNTVTMPLSTPQGQRTLLAVGAGAAAPLVAVLGAIGVTGEFRHATATTTFLATPRRGRVLVAKSITYAAVAAGYGSACAVLTVVIAKPWLASRGISLLLTANGIPATLAGVVLAVTLFGLIGVALGAVLREQVVTVVGLLIYLFVVEPILTGIAALDPWTMYLPGPARSALTQTALTFRQFLAPLAGGLVLTAYAVALTAAASVLTIRRDIT
jgi:ABC-2 type transport system permease protein